MGYLFLAISLFCGKAKGYCGKKTSTYINSLTDAITANVIRMALCVILGLFFMLLSKDFSDGIRSTEFFLIALLSGISNACFVVSWLIAVQKNAYLLLDVFLMMSILVPLLCSQLFFGESVKLLQWLGLLILLIATFFMCLYNNSIKPTLSWRGLLLLTFCGLSNGIADFSQKLFTARIPQGSASYFNFYTYLFAVAVLLIVLWVLRTKQQEPSCLNGKKILLPIVFMAIFLFLNSYFKTLAAARLSAVHLFPLNQGGSLILSFFMSYALFQEKPNGKAICAIILAFIGLCIIHMV